MSLALDGLVLIQSKNERKIRSRFDGLSDQREVPGTSWGCVCACTAALQEGLSLVHAGKSSEIWKASLFFLWQILLFQSSLSEKWETCKIQIGCLGNKLIFKKYILIAQYEIYSMVNIKGKWHSFTLGVSNLTLW